MADKQILIADKNQYDAEMIARAITLMAPEIQCHICHLPECLQDVLSRFNPDYIFTGFFDNMSSEEILRAAQEARREAKMVLLYKPSRSSMPPAGSNGWHAVFEKSSYLPVVMERLKPILA